MVHLKQPQDKQIDEDSNHPLVVEVVVEQPGQTCNLYHYEREWRALRLDRLLFVETVLPADLAALPLERQGSALERIGERGRRAGEGAVDPPPDFPVLLLSRVAVTSGAWVPARLIGAVRPAAKSGGERPTFTQGWRLLAIPVADAAQEGLRTTSELPNERREALGALVVSQEQGLIESRTGSAASAAAGGAVMEWVEASEATQIIRRARAAWRQAQRQRGPASQGPREHLDLSKRRREAEQHGAWRVLEAIPFQQRREQGLGGNAEAEHLLRLVPQRFQQYLGELLLEDERILCFIERPRLRVRRGVLGVGTQYLSEGMLLCTDRQVLWLRDVAAPDATLVPWGYRARSCPVERLESVQVVQAGEANKSLDLAASPRVRLVIRSAAAGGIAALVIEFPESALAALQQATVLLERFLPFPAGSREAGADRRVRRLPTVSVWQPRAEERDLLLQLGGIVPVAARERLEAALAQALRPGEVVLAQAVAPALDEYPGGSRLLALTPERLLFGQTEDGGQRKARAPAPRTTLTSVALAQVAAVQLRHSLLGCAFEVVVPGGDSPVTPPFVPFNSPGIVPFRAIYTRTRLLLACPYQGAAVSK